MAEAREVVASAARTTSSNSGSLNLPGGESVALLVDVTAVSGGTPSMTVTVEWSHNGTDFAIAEPADTHGAAITGTLKRAKAYAIKGPYYRVVWAITGTTPSFTFAVSEHTTT